MIYGMHTHMKFFLAKQILHQKVANNSRYGVTLKKYFFIDMQLQNTDKILISKSAFEAYFPNLLNTFYRI